MRALPGFSLLELVATIAIAGIVSAAATQSAMMIYRRSRATAKAAAAVGEANRLAEMLMVPLEQVGGGSVRPWDAIQIDDNASPACASARAVGAQSAPACAGTDRVHALALRGDAPQCPIASITGTTLRSSGATCCLTVAHQADVVLASAAGTWANRRCRSVNTAACTCTLDAAAAGYESNAALSSYAGGTLAVGKVSTWYVAGGVLHELVDDDDDGDVDDRTIADGVYDLQAELAYDTDGDSVPDTFAPAPGALDRAAMRGVRVGVIVGADAQLGATSSATLMNGTTRSSTTRIYESAVRSAPARATGLFQ